MKIISFPDSKFNKNITLIKNWKQATLIVDGLIESGEILTHIWNVGLKKLLPKYFKPKKILLLGLGGGSNAVLVAKKYPMAQITAVEIDPQMVEIANSYFGLSKIKNLNLVTQDAIKYVRDLRSEIFDLVLVDCFVGKNIPKKFEKLNFIDSLVTSARFVLINRVWFNEYHFDSVFFLKSLSKKYHFEIVPTGTNIVISIL